MIKFLTTALKIAGLTYQLAATVTLIGALGVGVIQATRNRKRG
jgi:hypothetical protein